MSLYLDTNVFYNAYCPVENASIVDWLFTQLHLDFPAFTSEWCLIEMFRAFKKQVNLGTIAEKDAEIALDYFLSDIGEMVKNKTLTLIPVTQTLIIASRELIFTNNLYAADALHAATAMKLETQAFITFDSDFKASLGDIPIINPSTNNFKSKIIKFMSK
ncbi:MAG TPA: PIN domain-containing protein [candidate division Zixibacteria bacterium]|nr:PIN domain-containing protein [candidate division Zixibacteria bacterium]